MMQEILQEQVRAHAERPAAPTGQAEQPQGAAFSEAALVELTDADLQAVSGGAGRGGITGDV